MEDALRIAAADAPETHPQRAQLVPAVPAIAQPRQSDKCIGQ